jgi:hypothetical protein
MMIPVTLSRERHPPGVEHEPLRHPRRQVQPGRRTQQPREQEEIDPVLLRRRAEPMLQVGVNGGDLKPVVERQQHVRDDHVPGHIPEHHLQIGEVRCRAPGPGTEMNVTPDSESPISPKATTYQGDARFPRK